ncbi:tubulin nucleotide-binding protein [Coleophoma cylindrospora]|uniref:Tubulin nucleotide-binding protein n=1 Tax=Coleophoma cylindrospora TaxID=1849047 RepID=A0A3D8RBA8_9HELO|nr:tubulin nucleotide-binding protein [Coleophoma cylindrospora]
MHEILTLQLGQRSNYLATHFWNAQESYFTYSSDQESPIDHDVHFRPGIGADGTETFTPRTLIYDLKGGFGSLRKINALYEIDEPGVPQGLWNGPTVVHRQTPIVPNEYQQSLEEGSAPPQLTTESVRYWSDFNRVFFHPRSIVQLNEYELNSSLMPFENWDTGESLFSSLDKEHDLLDRDLRPFAEEADQMQGIQIFSGTDDAWGGFAARYMDRIRDEYGKTTVWFWGSEDVLTSIPREKRVLKMCNTARCISEISTQASLFIPLTLPSRLPTYVNMNIRSSWHVSGLLSAAMESMTLPSRLKSGTPSRELLDHTGNALNINGNQTIARLRMSIQQKPEAESTRINGDRHQPPDIRAQSRDTRMPTRNQSKASPEAGDKDDPDVFDMDFFPANIQEVAGARGMSKKPHVFGQAENWRGPDNGHDEEELADVEDEGFTRARRRALGLPLVHKTRVPVSFPTLDSFPRILVKAQSGSSTSIATSLSTDTTVALRIKALRSIVGRAVSINEREALGNSLGEIAEAYEEGYDSGSDEDDD